MGRGRRQGSALRPQQAGTTQAKKDFTKAIRALAGFERKVRGAKPKVTRQLRRALLLESRQVRADLRKLKAG